MSNRKRAARPGSGAMLVLRSPAAVRGMGLALDLLDEVRAELERSGSATRARRGKPPYMPTVDRYLRRAREAGPDVEHGFTELLRRLAKARAGRRA